MRIPISQPVSIIANIISGKKKEKWMQKMVKSPKFEKGALRKHFGLKKDETMTLTMIDKELDRLSGKYPKGGYSKPDLELVRQLNSARNMMTR